MGCPVHISSFDSVQTAYMANVGTVVSPLKLLGQMEPYLTGGICWKVFTKFLHFILIRQQIWPPWTIVVSVDILKLFSKTVWPKYNNA